jgi:hypothetical protein
LPGLNYPDETQSLPVRDRARVLAGYDGDHGTNMLVIHTSFRCCQIDLSPLGEKGAGGGYEMLLFWHFLVESLSSRFSETPIFALGQLASRQPTNSPDSSACIEPGNIKSAIANPVDSGSVLSPTLVSNHPNQKVGNS